MPFSVSSAFVSALNYNTPYIKRRFTISGSDYTRYVTKWPSISNNINNITSKSVTIKLANESGVLNDFKTNVLLMVSSCSIDIGVEPQKLSLMSDIKWTPDLNYVDSINYEGEPYWGSCVTMNDSGNTLCVAGYRSDITTAGLVDSSGGNYGAIRVFKLNSLGEWSQTQIVTEPNSRVASGFFGNTIRLLTVDSYDYLFASAHLKTVNHPFEGTLHIYQGSGNGYFTPVSSVNASSSKYVLSNFKSFDVAYDSVSNVYSGCVHIVSGAPLLSNAGSNDALGGLFTFVYSLGNHLVTQVYDESFASSGYNYGTSVNISNNATRVHITSPFSTGMMNVYKYAATGSLTLVQSGVFTNSAVFMGSVFGGISSNIISSNYDGKKIVIGSPSTNSSKGAVYLFVESTNGTVNLQQTLNTTLSNSDNTEFGNSVYMSDSADVLYIGAHLADIGIEFYTGALCTFLVDSSNSYYEKLTRSPAPKFLTSYGGSVYANKYGNRLAVSGFNYNPGSSTYGDLRYGMFEILSHPVGFDLSLVSSEYINIFQGTIDTIKYSNNEASVILRDKFEKLINRTIGTNEAPAVFSSSTLLTSDVFWSICTCYGGLDSTANSSNVDIDYTTFEEWANVFSQDSIFVGAEFKGVKCIEALRKIARYTDSSIVAEGGKLYPKRWSASSGSTVTYAHDNKNIKTINDEVSLFDVVNQQKCLALYNTNSEAWGIDVTATHTPSVNSFGIREVYEQDASIWYVSSAATINFCERRVSLGYLPQTNPTFNTLLMGLQHTIGDVITLVSTQDGIYNDFRVSGYTKDLDSMQVQLKASTSLILAPFRLDISELDGTDLLT